jgi:beta-lactamase regulating signal transducer with metallopeptidase domain
MFAQFIDGWSEALAWVWISAVPRQAALILGVALLIRSQPRMAAAWRHWMWLVAALAIGLIPLAAVLLPRLPLIPAEWIYGEDAMAVSQAGITPVGAQMSQASPYQLVDVVTFGWVEWSFVVWFVGAFLLVARLGMGLFGLRSFQRDCLPVVRGRLCARLEHCRRVAGVSTLVDLYLSKRSPLPMTWGVVRPAINLPVEAEQWSDERLDAVFLHELGHIHRADCWTNMVLKLVCALNWFNPFVWMAARRTYLAQEVACDDFACARLLPSNYARHLLELTAVVKDFRRSDIEPAVGLSSCDHLRLRVAAALDPDRSRAFLPSEIASMMSGAVFLSMGLMAMVSLRFVEEAHAVKALRAEITAESSATEPDPVLVEESVAAAPRPLERVRQLGAWFQAFPEKLEGVILQGAEVDESRQESSLGVPFVEEEEPALPKEDPPVEDAAPVVVPAVLAVPNPLVVKPKVVLPAKAQSLDVEKIDWRSFSRRSGSRRGSTIVLNYEESVCNRYARLSPTDRKKQGSFRDYLKRNRVHLSEAGIRRLIERTRRNQL